MSWICDLSVGEYLEAANYHKDSTPEFIEKALLLAKTKPHEITTCCSNLGKTVKKRANQVLREIHLLSAYIRLKPYPEMVLAGSCKPEHNILYFVCKSIAKRFDQFIIVIFAEDDFAVVSNRREVPKFPSFQGNTREEVIDNVRAYAKFNLSQRLPEEILMDEGDFLWKKYYETQFLEQRLNTKLFHRFIPKYALDKAEMKIENDFLAKITEKTKKNSTLDEYLKQDIVE